MDAEAASRARSSIVGVLLAGTLGWGGGLTLAAKNEPHPSTRYKEKNNTGNEIECNQLHASQPGGFAVQADQREENSGKSHNNQFKWLKNHVEMYWKEKTDQYQQWRNQGCHLYRGTGGNRHAQVDAISDGDIDGT